MGGASPETVAATAPEGGGDARPPRRPGRSVPPWLEVGAAWSGRALLVIGLAALAVIALSRLLIVVVAVLVALFLASILHQPTLWLRRRLPDTVASLLAIAGLVLLIVAVAALVVVPVAGQGAQLGAALQDGLVRAASSLGASPDQLVTSVQQAVEGLLQGGGALSGLSSAASVVGGAVLAVIVLFFFLREGERIWRGALGLVGEPRRAPLERFGRRSWSTLRGYFIGVTIVAAVDALLIGLALLGIGVPFALPLALLTFAAAYFPFVGAVAAGVLGTLVAFVTVGPTGAVMVAVAFLVVQQIEGNLLYPYIMRGQVAIHPLTTVLAVTVGGTLVGVLGAFLSIPVAAVISATVREEAGVESEA